MSHKDCECCAGTQILTPVTTANRPGLSEVRYRIGTHATFLETMLARLGGTYVERPLSDITDWSLQADDIRQLDRFALRLQRAGDPFTTYLRGQFSEGLQQQLADFDESEPAAIALEPALLEEINEILTGPSLFRPALVSQLNMSPSLQNLASQPSFTGDDLLRLNRLILEAAYPDLIVSEQRLFPLQALTTRATADPAIAMLDAWATVGDVLTFYQERLANEGYLGTALERRSILELANLIGYRLRPGVAASTYLAFTLEDGHEVDIPVGTRAQSLPGPGELPQPFETAEPLYARDVWNVMQPRLTEPHILQFNTIEAYLQGLQTELKPNDPLLLFAIDGGNQKQYFRRLRDVELQPELDRTRISLSGRIQLETLEELINRDPEELRRERQVSAVAYEEPLLLAADEEHYEVTFRWRPAENVNGNAWYSLRVYELDIDGTCEAVADVADGALFIEQTQKTLLLNAATDYCWRVDVYDDISFAQADLQTLSHSDVPELEREAPGQEQDAGQEAALTPAPGATIDSLRPTFTWDPPPELVVQKYLISVTDEAGTQVVDSDVPLQDNVPVAMFELPLPLAPLHDYTWEVTAEVSGEPEAAPTIEEVLNSQFRTGYVSEDDAKLQPADGTLDVSVGDTLRWDGDADRIYSVRFGLDPEFSGESSEITVTGTSLDMSELPQEDQLSLARRRYYWQVFDQDKSVRSPLWRFTRDGELPQEGQRHGTYQELTVRLKSRINAHPPLPPGLLTRLNDLNTPASTLKAYIDIEEPALRSARSIFASYFSEHVTEYPMSRYDYSELREWIQQLYDELTVTIADQLKLVPVLTGSERIFENQYINPVAVGSLEAFVESPPGFPADSSAAEDFGDADFESLLRAEDPPGISTLIENLVDNSLSEDDKIVQARGQYFRVLDLLVATLFYYSRDSRREDVRWVLDLYRHVEQLLERRDDPADEEGEAEGTRLTQLQAPPSIQPDNPLRLERQIEEIFSSQSDLSSQLVTAFNPELEGTYYKALAQTDVSPLLALQKIEMLRVKAIPFGARKSEHRVVIDVLPDVVPTAIGITGYIEQTVDYLAGIQRNVIMLDAEYEKVQPGSWVAVATAGVEEVLLFEIRAAETITKPDHGKVTRLVLDDGVDWRVHIGDDIDKYRETNIFTQSEQLSLTRKPIRADVAGKELRLDGLYDRFQAGRWLIVAGERTDIPNTTGIHASELVMIAGVQQIQITLDDGSVFDRPFTKILLANELAFTYKRDTVTVHGNVARATHGETRVEVLGSGNGASTNQSFTLKQPPLTYLAAPTENGIASTLELRVNDVLWHEVDNLIWLGPHDRGYFTKTDNDDRTIVSFGDGKRGARLPTGVENIKAVYRNGIGKPGNVAAGKISLLASKPLGVKEVINPLPATGGANREERDQARRNVPVAVTALERLVSLSDYADFARTFAGIGKATVVRLSDGRRQIIHLTIAGVDDIPINETSDVYQALCQAIHRFGTLNDQVIIETREQMLLLISASVRLQADYTWETVAPQIRAALLDQLSFERQQLAQDVLLSEVQATIQGVTGVAYSDVDYLDGIHEDTPQSEIESLGGDLRLRNRIVVPAARVQRHHVAEHGNETLATIAFRYGKTTWETLEELNLDILRSLFTDDHWDDLSAAEKQAKPLPVHASLFLGKGRIRPAQIAYLSPDIPDMLILEEVTE